MTTKLASPSVGMLLVLNALNAAERISLAERLGQNAQGGSLRSGRRRAQESVCLNQLAP
jgi:hypothetical protein